VIGLRWATLVEQKHQTACESVVLRTMVIASSNGFLHGQLQKLLASFMSATNISSRLWLFIIVVLTNPQRIYIDTRVWVKEGVELACKVSASHTH